MSVESKSYNVTNTASVVLESSFIRGTTEFVNTGQSQILIQIGGATFNAVNAIPIASGQSWYSQIPVVGPVHAQAPTGSGTLVIVANDQG